MQIANEEHAQIAIILTLMRRLGVYSVGIDQTEFDEAVDHFFSDDMDTGTIALGYDDKTQTLTVSFPRNGELQ